MGAWILARAGGISVSVFAGAGGVLVWVRVHVRQPVCERECVCERQLRCGCEYAVCGCAEGGWVGYASGSWDWGGGAPSIC
ncbi:hypothetical protein DFH09DRAFT_1161195 [Mycena vulgaris]|nr:hypothetical protein DFH09DRAFT_1161195 [Mycena vulgaris]